MLALWMLCRSSPLCCATVTISTRHLRVGDGRNHSAVTALDLSSQAPDLSIGKLQRDERANAGIEQVGSHRVNLPSSLATGLRLFRKSASAFGNSVKDVHDGRAGRRVMTSPSFEISSSAIPSKAMSRGSWTA